MAHAAAATSKYPDIDLMMALMLSFKHSPAKRI